MKSFFNHPQRHPSKRMEEWTRLLHPRPSRKDQDMTPLLIVLERANAYNISYHFTSTLPTWLNPSYRSMNSTYARSLSKDHWTAVLWKRNRKFTYDSKILIGRFNSTLRKLRSSLDREYPVSSYYLPELFFRMWSVRFSSSTRLSLPEWRLSEKIYVVRITTDISRHCDRYWTHILSPCDIGFPIPHN
jgi:hypothetical protein